MLCDPLSGEFGITMFDGFAVALLDAAGCLGANLDLGIIRPAKTC